MYRERRTFGRISRYQNKRYMRQTIFLLLSSIAVLVSFFFLFLPLSARLVELISKSKPTQVVETQETIQAPVLQPIIEATNSGTLDIGGYVQTQFKVQLYQNGSVASETNPDADGLFSFLNVSLKEGENQFFVKSVKDEKNSSSPSTLYSVLYKTSSPNLTVESPTDGMVVTSRKNQVISISGMSEPNARVYLNDRLLTVDGEGHFTGNYQLTDNENILKFKALDLAGNETLQELKVTYLP